MKLSEKISDYIGKIAEYKKSDMTKKMLPGNCCFLEQDTVLCFKRDVGDSRYPYCIDGFTLWAHSSGYVSVNESTFYVILPSYAGREPFVSFFGGIKNPDGSYEPISITNITRMPKEMPCDRYTVYTPTAAYYIAETKDISFGLRLFVRADKEVCYSLIAVNKTDQEKEIYLSHILSCLLKNDSFETVETNWFRECKYEIGGYMFESVEDLSRIEHITHYGVLRRLAPNSAEISTTCARSVYTGGSNNPLILSPVLSTGKFAVEKNICKFTDTPVAGDMIRCKLAPKQSASIDYVLSVRSDEESALQCISKPLKEHELDEFIAAAEKRDNEKFLADSMLKMSFDEMVTPECTGDELNNFMGSVTRQVEFAALAKNSGVSLLGVRDVFQQLEAALIWNAPACREKILEALNFIDISGRPPRQYSIPPKKGALPRMDLRAFIDQGVWIINTIYSYLSYTGDYSLLSEECGYYEFCEGNSVKISQECDSVLSHLERITNYMTCNIDASTGCLKALYGDWNDALDGLGVSVDKKSEYGSGVSVMASLQLYQNLIEMIEIINKVCPGSPLLLKYAKTREVLKQGLMKNAIDVSGNRRKILHGWGDKRGYKIGSFCDSDGKERDGLTSNAFWIISDLYREDETIKASIMESYKKLDSKYGLKTFEPYFPKDMRGVGRIINLPVGTAENAATYIHSTLFGIWSLFKIGEDKMAWEQLFKILPMTHKMMSTTPFIMSNSYSYNEQYGMDGESMSDWFTGSANVFLKVMVRYVFGVDARLGGVLIQPSNYMPAKKSEIKVMINNAVVGIIRERTGKTERKFFVNGNERKGYFDSCDGVSKLFVKSEELFEHIEIKIVD